MQAAKPYLKDLEAAKKILDSVEGQLLCQACVMPVLSELYTVVVCKETLRSSKISTVLKPYKRSENHSGHPEMAVRLKAGHIMQAWKQIYAGSTKARSASEFDAMAARAGPNQDTVAAESQFW